MKLNRILVVLLLLVLSIGLIACKKTYDVDNSEDVKEVEKVLFDAVEKSFESDAYYIKIKEQNDKGELKTIYVVNSYKPSDDKYAKDTRLTFIDDVNSGLKYWGGKDKDSEQSYLVKGTKDEDGNYTYAKQKIDSDNIFAIPQLAVYNRTVLLAGIHTLNKDVIDIKEASKSGDVTTIKLNVAKEHDPVLSELGTLELRITNGYLLSVKASEMKGEGMFSEEVVHFQIDILPSGEFFSTPLSNKDLTIEEKVIF